MPKVSIIITAHNYGKYLEQCLESALNQNYDDYEVIVVNDGSTDNTAEILRKYEDRVKVINLPGLGLAAACNRGIAAASGE
ncbi:MAG TPA: glycosyltransferase family 2 protein, partial [Hadesarchaea archaeon]|nr:glycosyltransferase family 2 protein [Hadesarchaea archaeon]